jgi:hypothetical protein
LNIFLHTLYLFTVFIILLFFRFNVQKFIFLTGLISEAFIFILPDAIAPLINSGTNFASFNGHVSLKGEIMTETWRAPFIKSEAARRLLNISIEEGKKKKKKKKRRKKKEEKKKKKKRTRLSVLYFCRLQ